MPGKQLWILAGGNGAGKSTFYERYLEPRGLPFVNADRIAQSLAQEPGEDMSYEAAVLAERLRLDALEQGKSFCFETVFSHPSKVDFMARAKALGYQVVLVVIHLRDPGLNVARVSQRVTVGGHDVPEAKILSRIPRTLNNIRKALPLADEVHLIDNSSAEDPFRHVAVVRDGEARLLGGPTPDWAAELLRPRRKVGVKGLR